MAQFVMVVTVGNRDSEGNTDIDEIRQVLNNILEHEHYRDRGNDYWPITIRPLSEVIDC